MTSERELLTQIHNRLVSLEQTIQHIKDSQTVYSDQILKQVNATSAKVDQIHAIFCPDNKTTKPDQRAAHKLKLIHGAKH